MKTLTLASFFLSLSCFAESGDIKLVCETTWTKTDSEGVKSDYDQTFNLVFNDSTGKFCTERKCGRETYFRGQVIKFTSTAYGFTVHSTLKVTEWSPLQVSIVHRGEVEGDASYIKYHLDREDGTLEYTSGTTHKKGSCTKVTKFKDEKKPKF